MYKAPGTAKALHRIHSRKMMAQSWAHLQCRLQAMGIHRQLSSHRSQEQLTGNVRRLSICVRPSIAHLETQYSWAQIRLAATSLGSRPTGMEAPRSRCWEPTYTSWAMKITESNLKIVQFMISNVMRDCYPFHVQDAIYVRIGESTTLPRCRRS